MPNIKMTVAYDGGAYLGWQKTPMGPSIEQAIQNILEQVLQEKISLQAASRTDAGVHAVGQVVNFYTKKDDLQCERLCISLNSLLPKDIAVLGVQHAENAFHPTLDCIGKEYHYSLCYGTAQLPQHRFYSWHYPHRLNLQDMQEAAKQLVGKYDYSSFCNVKKNEEYDHYVRIVERITVVDLGNQRLCFQIQGNNFLYKMVRNLVGTIVYVGRGKLLLSDLPDIIASRDRTRAGVTAPAHGLTLYKVFYD